MKFFLVAVTLASLVACGTSLESVKEKSLDYAAKGCRLCQTYCPLIPQPCAPE